MSAPRLVILESPYAGDVERNVAYARRAMSDSLARGEAPIASHLLYTQPGVLDDNWPDQRALGIAAGLAWARVADAAVIYIDHGISPGMQAAMDYHEALGLQIEPRRIGEEPATNQAGEVALRAGDRVKFATGEAGEIIRCDYVVQLDEPDGSQGAMGGSVGTWTVEASELTRAALATQPATSQEGEIGTWQENVEFLLAKCPHTIRGHEGGGPENLIVSLVLTFGKMQHMLAATPTPPLLDLRECCDLSITSADIWEALFAIYKQDVPPAITEGVCNQLASCLEWSRPSGRVMAALAAQENAEDGRASCVNCEGEGMWEHCPSCSLAFGRAIDLRRATLATQPATSQEGEETAKRAIVEACAWQSPEECRKWLDRAITGDFGGHGNLIAAETVMKAFAIFAATPTPPAAEGLQELVAMLEASTLEDGVRVYEHDAEEIGIATMDCGAALLAALARAPEVKR